MGPKTVFACGNLTKCANTIAADGLNKVQLKALRLWPKTCSDCGKQTKWIEQLALFDNIQTQPQTQRIGGRKHGKNDNGTSHIH